MLTPLRRMLSRDVRARCNDVRGRCNAARRGVAGVALAVSLLLAVPAMAQDGYPHQPGDDGAQGQQAGDPPSQVARISVVVGDVSVEPASVNQFSAAEVNLPLTTGDRVYADVGANAELETDQLAVRLGQRTDLTVTAMTDTLAQFGLAGGSVHLRSFAVDPNTTVELDTPNVAVTVLEAGDVRVDVDSDDDRTVVSVIAGQVEVDGNGLQQVLEPGQRMELGGSHPVTARWLDATEVDGLDRFSMDRDTAYDSSVAGEAQYVSPETIGAEDLSANGDWETDAEYGPIWYPTGVAVGWVPYSCGRWAWVAPWGWTWVECESWGFAPFHYGRWERRGPRWGWIPGPPGVRPYYSPALVAFVGGAGVTAWFPLGPREPYVPWYHASGRYVNRVNVSNIYDRNAVQVRHIYDQQTESSAYVVNGKHVFVNRPIATVAVSQASFAAGKRVRPMEVQVSREELAAAPLVPHLLVSPQRTMVVSAPARAVPVRVTRPVLVSSREGRIARPAGQVPLQAPVHATSRPMERAMEPGLHPQPAAAPIARQPAAAGGGRSQRAEAPVETATPVERPLFNRAVPPPTRPSFEQQQRAMDSRDPGRPLSPQQMNNVRQNQPVGPPQERERPHSMPPPMQMPPTRVEPRSAPSPPSAPKR